VQVTVKTLKGEALDVEIENSSSVLDLNRKLALLKVLIQWKLVEQL